MAILNELQREPLYFDTKREAIKHGLELIQESYEDCKARYGKCTKVGSLKRDGDCTIKIGGKDGYHTWTRITIS